MKKMTKKASQSSNAEASASQKPARGRLRKSEIEKKITTTSKMTKNFGGHIKAAMSVSTAKATCGSHSAVTQNQNMDVDEADGDVEYVVRFEHFGQLVLAQFIVGGSEKKI